MSAERLFFLCLSLHFHSAVDCLFSLPFADETVVTADTFFGLDELARQLERPFDDEPQCLPLRALCRVIEISAQEALGQQPLPLLEPVKDIILM